MTKHRRPLGGLIYSTELGRTCPQCRRSLHECACARNTTPVAAGPIRVSRETKGRNGKAVTLISGVPLAGDALDQLAAALKKRCGSGGTVKQGIIEIQGDHREAVIVELGHRGYTARRAGG